MKNLINYLLITFIMTCSIIAGAQEPCESACCVDGTEHTFEGETGNLPTTAPMFGGWYAPNGNPYYLNDDGCDNSTTSIVLNPVSSGNAGDMIVYSIPGINPHNFEEGKTYCIQLCQKVVGTGNGMLKLFADNFDIGNTPTQVQADGWQTIQVIYSPTINYFNFSIQNISAGPVDGDPNILVDNVCISEYNPDAPSCMADFDYEISNCGEVCFINNSCGDFSNINWSLTGPGLPVGGLSSDATNPCFSLTTSGVYSMTLFILCEDGTTSSKTEEVTVNVSVDPPTVNCPDELTLIGNGVDGQCEVEYTIPNIPFTNGTMVCFYNGNIVNAGDVLVLNPGTHIITCVVTGECDIVADCGYTITVECEEENNLCGKAVMTAFSGIDFSPSATSNQDLNGPVVGIVDNGNWSSAPSGSNWTLASSGIYSHNDWDAGHLGEVFGLATDNSNNIYVASSSIYGVHPTGPAGNAGIYKLNAATGSITNLVVTGPYVPLSNVIPNDGAGYGNICYTTHSGGTLYATNLYDGMIYQIDANNGNVKNRFNPFGSTTPTGSPGFSDLGKRPWAVGYNSIDNKLYYSNWNGYTYNATQANNEIFAVNLNSNGDFVGIGNVEKTITEFVTVSRSSPLSDISFSFDGKMLLGHKTMLSDYISSGYWAHRSIVLEYEKISGTWNLTPGHIPPYTLALGLKYGVGSAYRDGAGGVSYGYESFDSGTPDLCATSMWATSDALSPTHGGGAEPWIYGLTGMPSSGGSSRLDVIIDWNNDVTTHDKGQIGDVEIFQCGCETSEVNCDSLSITSTPTDIQGQEGCCYSFDIENNWGADIIGLEAELLGTEYVFSNVFAQAPFTLGSSLLNDKFCLLESSGGSVPTGLTTDAFDACISPTVPVPSGPATVVFKWKQLFNDSDTLAICSDTLYFECGIDDDECVFVINEEVMCSNEENPSEYELCFQVVNNSGGPISQVTIEDLPPGFFFAYPLTNSKVVNIPSLPDGGTSGTICVNIVSVIPLTAPTNLCMKFGAVSSNGMSCCHNPDEICVEIDPCCDPCEDNGIIATKILESDSTCCYSIGLINECSIPYFTKFEAEILTTGVDFGSHVIDPAEAGNWIISSSPKKIGMTPVAGTIVQPNYPGLLDFCLDKTSFANPNPQIIFRWYTIDPISGEPIVACTDLLTTDCDTMVNTCAVIDAGELICLPGVEEYQYTFTVTNTSSPSFTADKIHLVIKNDASYVPVPTGTIIPLTPPLAPGASRTITTNIAGSPFPFPHSDFVFGYRLQNMVSGDCCFESKCDTIPTPSCDPDVLCCEDFDAFCDLVDLGFQVIVNDCEVFVEAIQFDDCHWFGTPEPDWGDGSIGFPVLTPATSVGPWTHNYTQNGTYNICITVYEGNDVDSLCWNKQMCTPVVIDCIDDCDIVCDAIDFDLSIDPDIDEDCCFIGSIDNNLCESFAKGVLVETNGSSTIAQLTTLNGWTINQISTTEAELYPPVVIVLGQTDIFKMCNENNAGPTMITLSWLVDDGNGGCTEECAEEFTMDCGDPISNQCIEVVSDSISCLVKEYCITIKNVTNPGFDIKSVTLHDVTPVGSLTPTIISIPSLAPSATTEVCIYYQGVMPGDDVCYKLVGHDVDLNQVPFPTQCCLDTIETCFIVPDECLPDDCCDISDPDFAALLNNVNITGALGSCQACVEYDLDDCTQMTLSFQNGSNYIVSGQGIQCQNFPVNFTGTVTATIVRFDQNGDICKTATKDMQFDAVCDCCSYTDDDLLDEIDDAWGNVSIDSCQLCIPFEVDDCMNYTIDYGDGTVLTGNGANTLCHSYAAPGNYTISINMVVYDNAGNICAEADALKDVNIDDCIGTPMCDPDKIVIYNAISPENGDGLNDKLIIEGYGDCGQIDITIYNRWGQIVWLQKNYDNTWQGRSLKGEQLPDGTYYLILALPDQDDDKLHINTFIDLRRDL